MFLALFRLWLDDDGERDRDRELDTDRVFGLDRERERGLLDLETDLEFPFR
jgi:hypothetical protein